MPGAPISPFCVLFLNSPNFMELRDPLSWQHLATNSYPDLEPVNILSPYFFDIHFNIILPPMPRSTKSTKSLNLMCFQIVRSVMWYSHKHPALKFKQNVTSVKWKNKEGHPSNKNSTTGVCFVSISRLLHQLNFPGHKTHYNANTYSKLCYEQTTF